MSNLIKEDNSNCEGCKLGLPCQMYIKQNGDTACAHRDKSVGNYKELERIMDRINETAGDAASRANQRAIEKHKADTIWNAAIDAAAKECEAWDKGSSPKADIAPEIRKLKR